jgi:hypothetical protein
MKSIKFSKLTLVFCFFLSSAAFAGATITTYDLIPGTNGAALTDNRV